MSIPDRRRKARCCTAEIAKNGTYHGFPSPKSKPYGAAAPNGGYDHPANTKGNEMKVKKTLMDMIIKWHQAGYSLDEIAPLMPQVPKEEIKAIIQHTRE